MSQTLSSFSKKIWTQIHQGELDLNRKVDIHGEFSINERLISRSNTSDIKTNTGVS